MTRIRLFGGLTTALVVLGVALVILGVPERLRAGHEVEEFKIAKCRSGYELKIMPGNEVWCRKDVKAWRFSGYRGCPPATQRVQSEAGDGGDLCEAAGVKVPALPCGLGERLDLNKNARDRCLKEHSEWRHDDVKTETQRVSWGH